MGIISVSLPADGSTADVADVNTPFNTIIDTINGNIDSSNIAAGGVATGSLATGIQVATKAQIPYKFSVNRTAAYTTIVTTDTAFPFDTAAFDTGTNVDIATNKGRFTAPVAGFYFFVGTISTGSNWTRLIPQLRVNGSVAVYGTDAGGTPFTGQVSGLLKLTANDYVEFYYYVDAAKAVRTGPTGCQFHGFLMSAT